MSDEDAPNYRSIIQNPIDMATILQHVDNGQYITCAAFMQDINLIVSNAKARICALNFFFMGRGAVGLYILKMLHPLILIFKACLKFGSSSATQAYNGEDYNGARIVSRACELRDAVHGLSQVLHLDVDCCLASAPV